MIFLVIIVLCYLVVEVIKKTPIRNEWLPIISGGLGVALSVGAYFAFPAHVPTSELLEMICYGFFGGLAATGSNQVLKQTLKYVANKYGVTALLPQGDTKEE